MIWGVERIAALVSIVILLRSRGQSRAWLRTAVVFVFNGAWRIFTALHSSAHFYAPLYPQPQEGSDGFAGSWTGETDT
jgi:hypothetical protein